MLYPASAALHFYARRKRHSLINFTRLEERRKVKGAAYYERKKIARRQLAQAKTEAGKKGSEASKELAALGY